MSKTYRHPSTLDRRQSRGNRARHLAKAASADLREARKGQS